MYDAVAKMEGVVKGLETKEGKTDKKLYHSFELLIQHPSGEAKKVKVKGNGVKLEERVSVLVGIRAKVWNGAAFCEYEKIDVPARANVA